MSAGAGILYNVPGAGVPGVGTPHPPLYSVQLYGVGGVFSSTANFEYNTATDVLSVGTVGWLFQSAPGTTEITDAGNVFFSVRRTIAVQDYALVNAGDYSGTGNLTLLTVDDAQQTISFTAGSATHYFDPSGLHMMKTIFTQSQDAIEIAPFGVGAGQTGEIRFLELAAGGTNYTGFKGPDALAANLIYVFPTTAPTAGQVLSAAAPSGGTAVLSWIAAGGGGITGSGTANMIPKWTGATSQGDSNIFTDNSGNVAIGKVPTVLFEVTDGTNDFLKIDTVGFIYGIGDLDVSNQGTSFQIDDTLQKITSRAYSYVVNFNSQNWFNIDVASGTVKSGDISAFTHGTIFTVDDTSRLFTAIVNGNTYLSLDATNFIYSIGDVSNDNFGTRLILNDSTRVTDLYSDISVNFYTALFDVYTGGHPYLLVDVTSKLYKLGDIDGVVNGTLLFVDDGSKTINITTSLTAGVIALQADGTTGITMNGAATYTGTVAGAAAKNVVNGLIMN